MRSIHPSAWLLAALLCSSLGLSPHNAFGACTAPIPGTPTQDARGRVRVHWDRHGCQPDTLQAHSGGYVRGFMPAEGYPVQAIAIKLDSLTPGTTIGAVRAYFLGKAGALAADWESKAAFIWSLHSDSTGYPSASVLASQLCPLGDDALLRAGGWRDDQLDWAVGGVLPANLLARRPLAARGGGRRLQIGCDGMIAPHAELAGVGMTEIEYWQSIPDPGLLVEVELQDGLGDDPPSVAIVRDWGQNPLSRDAWPPEILGFCSDGYIDPDVAWPESIRYGFITLCETAESDTNWTAAAVVTPGWEISAEPESLICLLSPTDAGEYPVTLQNPTGETLVVTVADAYLSHSGEDPVPEMSIGPTSQNIPAHGSVDFVVNLHSLASAVGTYRGAAILDVASIPDTAGFRLGIPIQVVVDQQTSVADPEADNGRLTPSGWHLSAGPNPFTESVSLRLAWGDGLILGDQQTSISSVGHVSPSAEVAVYNVLGQLILRERYDLDPMTVTQAGETTIQITGTSAWPTGVYIGRIDVAGRSKSIALLHIK